MNTIITFTLTQLVGLVLAICVAIATFRQRSELTTAAYRCSCKQMAQLSNKDKAHSNVR